VVTSQPGPRKGVWVMHSLLYEMPVYWLLFILPEMCFSKCVSVYTVAITGRFLDNVKCMGAVSKVGVWQGSACGKPRHLGWENLKA